MWCAIGVQPNVLVEVDRIDDQRVSLPLTEGVALSRIAVRKFLLWGRRPIEEDFAKETREIVFKQNKDSVLFQGRQHIDHSSLPGHHPEGTNELTGFCRVLIEVRRLGFCRGWKGRATLYR